MFEWDVQKAIANFEKHEVSFEEATTVFADPDGLDWEDSDHSQHEQRPQRIALSIAGRIMKKRNHPYHQCAASEPQRASGIFRTQRLIFQISLNCRMNN